MNDQCPALRKQDVDDWQIIVVDDDFEVVLLTRMILGNISFKGRNINVIEAFSAEEAMETLCHEKNIAVAIIDVVMEKEDSGLALVKNIREVLGNRTIRLYLRTGQPGHAPAESIIQEYDINEYREKTALTSRNLVTSVISCLRSYDDLCTITSYKENLEELVQERTRELENANRELRKYNRLIESDLMAGSKMQYKILPARHQQIQSFGFSRYLLSSMYLSGDFVDYFEITGGKIAFYMLDVSGHGTSSAFMTVIIKNYIERQLERCRNTGDSLIDKPHDMADYLNTEMMREKLGKYFTMFYGIIDKTAGTMRFVNCGQFPFPILKDSSGTRFISSGGPPIGLFGSPRYSEEQITLPDVFRLFLVSDGIFEFLDQDNLEKKKECLLSCMRNGCADIESAMKTLGLNDEAGYPDDITFLMIERKN